MLESNKLYRLFYAYIVYISEERGKEVKDSFLYNSRTHTLHMKGYCRHARGVTGYLPFSTEDEALAYDGRAVGMCKLCLAERDRRLMENREKKEGDRYEK